MKKNIYLLVNDYRVRWMIESGYGDGELVACRDTKIGPAIIYLDGEKFFYFDPMLHQLDKKPDTV